MVARVATLPVVGVANLLQGCHGLPASLAAGRMDANELLEMTTANSQTPHTKVHVHRSRHLATSS